MWCSIAIHRFNKVSTLPLHVLQLHQKWFIIGRIHGKSCRQADFFVISARVTASFFALCHISRLWWRCLNGSVSVSYIKKHKPINTQTLLTLDLWNIYIYILLDLWNIHTHTVGNCKKKSDKYDIYMYIYPGYVKIFILLRRDIMFLLASDIISQTIRGDWCTKYSSPLSIRSLSIFGLWRPTSLESPTSKCKMDRVSVSINTPLDRLAENPLK